MRKIFYKMLFIAGISVGISLTTGCADILEKGPDGRTSLDEVFADNYRAAAFLNTAYSYLPLYTNHGYFTTRIRVAASDEGWDCDDFDYWQGAGPRMYNGGVSSTGYPMTDFTTTNSHDGAFYVRFYQSIRYCCTFLERADEANITLETDRSRWKAEAHALRAWYYHELLRWFGAVPLVKNSIDYQTEDFSKYEKPSFMDVVDFILADCDSALNCPDLPWRITTDQQIYRITKAVVAGIKSRISLYAASPLYNTGDNSAEVWDKAYQINMAALQDLRREGYELYNKVNDAGQYSSADSHLPNTAASISNEYFTKNQTYTVNPIDKETIWTARTGPTNVWGVEGIGAQDGYKCGTVPTQESVDAYETANGEPVLDLAKPYLDAQHTQPNYNPKALAVNGGQYDPEDPYANRDPRFYASIYYNGSKRRAYYSFGETPAALDNYSESVTTPGNRTRIISTWVGEPFTGIHSSSRFRTRTGYYLRKFVGPTWGSDYSPSQPHEKYFRLGEIYLNTAEAAAETNHLEIALDLVNEIRSRAGMPALPYTLTREELILRIRNERRVELAFEGHRYFDVRRWQKPDGDLSATDRWVTAMEITRNVDGSGNFAGYTYLRRPVRPTERMCYTNQYLKAPYPNAEADKLFTLTGKVWQNQGW
jgi:hypothetical protein